MSITPEHLRQLSRRGVQHNDGQDYIVPARDIVEYNAALRAAADRLEAVAVVVKRYAGWYEGGPEDSWRFERDLRTALGMDQYSGDDDD